MPDHVPKAAWLSGVHYLYEQGAIDAAVAAADKEWFWKLEAADAEIARLSDRVTVLNLALMALLPVARTGGDAMPQEHARIVAIAEDALKA